MTQLAQQARERGWWADYGELVPQWFTEYVGLETAAREVWTYEQEYVPGLLQTKGYTKAVTVAVNSTGQAESAEGFARVRATRQQRLTSENPLILRAVINEAALRREVGDPDVMRDQPRWLIEVTTLPNVTVQVLPFSVGAHPGITGPFTTLRFAERSMNVVFIELRGGAVYQERPVDVDRHEAIFERLSDFALSEDDTTSLLNEIERGC